MRRPFAVATYVIGLIVAVLIPLLGFSAYLVIRSAQHEQEILGAAVRERTRGLARDLERELATQRSDLFIMANLGTVEGEGFAAFYARAHSEMERRGMSVILSDLDGNELVNTNRALGDALPQIGDRQAVRQVVATGEPYLSDLAISTVTHKPVVLLSVPVLAGRNPAYVASMDVLPSLSLLLQQQRLPRDWIAVILDRQGRTVVRTLDPQQYVGHEASPAFRERIRTEREGWFPFVSREGIPVYTAFDRVEPTGWTMVIAIPLNQLYAPLRRSTRELLLAGAGTLAVALLLAWLLGAHIARPISSLVQYAETVGRGEPVPSRRTGLRETDAVSRSLHQASENLQRSAAELRESEQRYRILAADLARANQERQQLLHRTVDAQEAERKRIARELHDSLGQYLTALRLGLSAVGTRCGAEAAGPKLAELKCLTTEVGHELSRISRELRPTVLDDLGLQSAVTQCAEEWEARSDLRFDLQINLGERRLPQAIETTLYRVLQEAITNVIRHANADRVGVILEAKEHEVRLIVEDNGIGFSPQEAGAHGGTLQHFGLIGIRERLALVNGVLEIESAPGGGTTLFVTVPV
ncbi:MAG TPA: cache domain-containing protein [Acetobacteraceae bacterium]|jgi:signal transduction histidine kinase